MAWRNKGGITGTNNIPLGPRKGQFGQVENGADASDSADVFATPAGPIKVQDRDGARSRKRKNRWGPEQSAKENKVLGLIGMVTALTSVMTPEQIEAYALQLRIEEITQKMKINDVVPAHRERSRSPPPTYDNMGRRTNTREVRYRKKLEDERHRLVEKAMKFIPEFKPPSDYRRLTRTQEKIYIPVNDYPEVNFIGQLIGPRGNTLKQMEAESGAKIAIRGKGSVKEGKGRSDAAANSNLEEDLHCLITADSEEKVAAAIRAVERVIENAASTPEAQNDLKKNQLRQLATLNGTLRDDEGQACQNCGEIGHRKYDCPQAKMFNAGVICRRCGQPGHFARDCKANLNGNGQSGGFGQGPQDTDKEYQELMNEIGGGSVSGIGYGQSTGRIEATPWQQQAPQPVGSVAPWVYNRYPVRHVTNFYQKAAAPWASQQAPAPPPPAAPMNFVPPPPPGMSATSASSFGPPPSLGPPPGLVSGMGGFHGGIPPPPSMGNGFRPPPPGASYPPPPPPSGGMYPPPPPPQ